MWMYFIADGPINGGGGFISAGGREGWGYNIIGSLQ